MKHAQVAAALVCAWFVGHLAYHLAPVSIEGHAWNICQSLARVILLLVIVKTYRSPLIDIPASGLIAEEVLVIGCTLAYLIKPWALIPGEPKCSSAVGLPLTVMCSVALIWVCLWLLDKLKGVNK